MTTNSRTMRGRARSGIAGALAVLALVASCSPSENAAPPRERAPATQDAALWFICDALQAPRIFTVRKAADDSAVMVTEYDKSTGAPTLRAAYELGAPVDAAGSRFWALLRDGAAAGNIREANPDLLDAPAAAYTPPIRSIDIGARSDECRWLPRTRLAAFDETHAIAIHEDPDGDLIYLAYDFANSTSLAPIALSDNGRSTVFSLEIRGGAEVAGPGGVEYRFENDGHLYLIVAPTNGPATIEIWRDNVQVQARTLIAHQIGAGATR